MPRLRLPHRRPPMTHHYLIRTTFRPPVAKSNSTHSSAPHLHRNRVSRSVSTRSTLPSYAPRETFHLSASKTLIKRCLFPGAVFTLTARTSHVSTTPSTTLTREFSPKHPLSKLLQGAVNTSLRLRTLPLPSFLRFVPSCQQSCRLPRRPGCR